MADYSRVNSTNPAITRLLDDYFDVLYSQDMDLFDKVFHHDCVLYSAQGGPCRCVPTICIAKP